MFLKTSGIENAELAHQNPFVLPIVPWEPLEFQTNVSKIIKIYCTTEIRTRIYCLRNFCPHRTADTILLKIKIFGKITLIKERKATLLIE